MTEKGMTLSRPTQEHNVSSHFSAIDVDRFRFVSEGERIYFGEERAAKGPQIVRVKHR